MREAEMIDFFESRGVVLFDAAMGTALMDAGQPPGTGSEGMNLSAPGTVLRIHSENIDAGCDVLTSNTFGVTQLMMRGEKEKALSALETAVGLAKQAAESGGANGKKILACLCVGPTGSLLGPLGGVSYEAAEAVFESQAEAGARCGADFVLLETFADIEELVRAARAAHAVSGLPVLGTMTFGAGGRSYMGASPADFVRAARACGLSAVGANCSLGPFEMAPVIEELIEAADGIPVIAQPNAGSPLYRDGRTVYEMTPEDFSAGAERLLTLGISAIGGCCGTTPAMISAVRGMIDKRRERNE